MLSRIVRIYVDAFRGLPREVWILSTVGLINRAGTMVWPFLSLYMTESMGASKGAAGWVLLSFGAGSLVGSYLGGKLTQAYGGVRVQELSFLFSGVGFFVVGQIDTIVGLAIGLFVLAVISDAFRPAVMAATVDCCPPELRTRALALLRLFVNAGMAIGPAVGGLLAALDYWWLFVADGLTCWGAGLVLFVTVGAGARRAAKKKEPAPQPTRRAARDGGFLALLALVFVLSFCFFQVFSTLPVYFHEYYGMSESEIGLTIGFNALLIVLFEMVLVRVLERREHLLLFGLGSVLVGVGVGLVPLGSGLPFALLTVCVWSLGEMLSLPFSNALVAARAGKGRSGEHMGLYSMAFAVAFIVAPKLGFLVYETLGPEWLFYGIAGAGLLVYAGCVVLQRRAQPWSPAD